MTLARACAHFTNWTAGHETRTDRLGAARLAFPPGHIEIDNRLSWLLGRLDQVWGNDAAYVHLLRDPDEVARSFANRASQGILRAYRTDIISRRTEMRARARMIDFAQDYVATVTSNISLFLRDKRHVMAMRVDSFGTDFDAFCAWIGAAGDLAAARAELAVRHNATETT
jgi:hypothetical protein